MTEFTKIDAIVRAFYGNIDLARHGIDLHIETRGLPSGILGLMLGELLGDRYNYKNFSVDVAKELSALRELDCNHPGPEHGARRSYVNSWLERQIPPDCNLLDFGCGTGRYKDYYNKASKVTAVDVNPYALMHLRAFFPDREKYSLVCAPFTLTNFESESFDCILLSAVIGYMPNSTANIILDECTRLLKDGGKIVVALLPTKGIADVGTHHMHVTELPNTPGSFHRKYGCNEMKRNLTARGYSVESVSNHVVKLPHFLRKHTNHLYRYGLVQSVDRILCSKCLLSTWQIIAGKKQIADAR